MSACQRLLDAETSHLHLHREIQILAQHCGACVHRQVDAVEARVCARVRHRVTQGNTVEAEVLDAIVALKRSETLDRNARRA